MWVWDVIVVGGQIFFHFVCLPVVVLANQPTAPTSFCYILGTVKTWQFFFSYVACHLMQWNYSCSVWWLHLKQEHGGWCSLCVKSWNYSCSVWGLCLKQQHGGWCCTACGNSIESFLLSLRISSGMEDGICSLPKERALVLFCKVPSSYSGHFQPSDEIDCGHPSWPWGKAISHCSCSWNLKSAIRCLLVAGLSFWEYLCRAFPLM